jgi:plastocyanin
MHVTNHMTAALGAAKDGSKRAVAVFAVLAATMALMVAMAAPAAAQTTVEGADGNVWSPSSIEVEAGTTVTFNMTGGDGAHNGQIVETGEEAFGFINVGDSTTYTFNEVGSFTLRCTIHPGMDLAVTVTEGEGNGEDTPPADEDEEPAEDEEPTEDEDPADTEDPTDPADTADDTDDVEQPTAVESGTGGLVNTGLPMWIAALIGLGALALVAPAVASRRRS